MARGDGTGPMGQGPLTGRGMGYCAGEVTSRRPVYGRGLRSARRPGFGRGAGFGRGIRGRGLGFRPGFGEYYVDEPINTRSEKEWLSEEKSILEDRLNLVKEELDNLADE